MKYDLIIIGGGINGAAIAADAAGRGLSVLLCEKDNLAQHTSWASTKLIHGGLRYLEQYDFKLVRESLLEREILMNKAPFLIHPLQFIMPYYKTKRPLWLIRLGLFLYDHLVRRKKIPGSKKLNLKNSNYGEPLIAEIKTGFSYYDCQTDDSRLTILTALLAHEKGAEILTQTEVIGAQRFADYWKLSLKSGDRNFELEGRVIVNAAGPWVNSLVEKCNIKNHPHLKLIKGSHFTVPKLYEGNHAYILQNDDKRIVFVIPYLSQFSLIGTTDVEFSGNANELKISDAEIQYLCDAVGKYFNKPIDKTKINWSFSGVRALLSENEQNPSEITRDYHLVLSTEKHLAPILSVYGGKLTTHRVLAEDALKRLKPYFPKMGPAWTLTAPLPGAEKAAPKVDWLPPEMQKRLQTSYGCRMEKIIGTAKSLADLGEHFGADLYQAEVDYLIKNEWVNSAFACAWINSKLGLDLDKKELRDLEEYISSCRGVPCGRPSSHE